MKPDRRLVEYPVERGDSFQDCVSQRNANDHANGARPESKICATSWISVPGQGILCTAMLTEEQQAVGVYG